MICSWYQLCMQGTHVRSEFFKLKYICKHFCTAVTICTEHNCDCCWWRLGYSSLHPCTAMRGGDVALLQAYSALCNPSGPCPYAGAGPWTGAPNVTVFCTDYICCIHIRNDYNYVYISVWRIQTAHVYLVYTTDTNCRSYHRLWNFVITTDSWFEYRHTVLPDGRVFLPKHTAPVSLLFICIWCVAVGCYNRIH
jgi:hypothetical protein